jgi:hypothetical protein
MQAGILRHRFSRSNGAFETTSTRNPAMVNVFHDQVSQRRSIVSEKFPVFVQTTKPCHEASLSDTARPGRASHRRRFQKLSNLSSRHKHHLARYGLFSRP